MKTTFLLIATLFFLAFNANAQTPEYWNLDLLNPGDGELAPNTENFTEGTTSCEVTIYTDGVPYLDSDEFAVTPGDDYVFSLDVYDDDPGMYFKLYADFRDADGNEIWGEDPVEVPDAPNWQTIQWTGAVPDGAVVGYIRIKSYDDEGFTGEASGLVDNCHFEVDGTNLVQNFSFEDWGGTDMIKAYSFSETSVHVVFDGPVPTEDPAAFTLSGTADITFGTGAIDPDYTNTLLLSDPSGTIEADNMLDQMTYTTTGTTYDFYAGILPIAYLNTANPDHIMNGYMATFHGIIFANDAYNNLWINDDSGPYNGSMIFSYDLAETLNMGDEILLTGMRDEYYGNTEISEATLLELISSGNNLYASSTITGAEIASDLPSGTESAEMWEGQLVEIQGAEVLSYDEENFIFTCTDDGNTTTFLVGDNVDYQFENLSITVGSTYDFIGVVDFTWDQYRINPRFQDDVIESTSLVELSQDKVHVYPNPASETIHVENSKTCDLITVTDLSGRVCASAAGNQTKISISVSDLRGGTYLINFVSNGQIQSSQKVIIR